MLVPQIRADASKLEVYKFIRLSLFREGVRYAREVNEEDALSVDMTNLNETFDNSETFDIEEVVIEDQLNNKRTEVVADFMFYECSRREGYVFYDLFVTDEHETLRSIADKHEVSHMTIKRIGLVLYERFKEHIKAYGYTADELLT
jgi:DNA-directed RNA polymerase sigma subunit (sigma70/sigma32)